MIPERMKQAIFKGERNLEFVEIDTPKPRPQQLLVKIQRAAICTLEQRLWGGTEPGGMKYPVVGGHEVAGEVVAIGEEVRQKFEIGDRVVLGVGSDAAVDYYSRRGRTQDSPLSWQIYGEYAEQYEGNKGLWGFGHYRVVNEGEAFKVSKDIPWEHVSLAEPLSCAVHGIRKLNIEFGDDVVVIGAGAMGLMNVMVAKLRGARVIVSELQPKRLERARRAGADAVIDATQGNPADQVKELTEGRGANFVITAVGGEAVTQQAVAMLDKRGEVLLFAAAYPAPSMSFDLNLIHHKEYVIKGTAGKDHEDLRIAAKMISDRLVNMESVIETTMPFEELRAALDLASKPDSYRVIVDIANSS